MRILITAAIAAALAAGAAVAKQPATLDDGQFTRLGRCVGFAEASNTSVSAYRTLLRDESQGRESTARIRAREAEEAARIAYGSADRKQRKVFNAALNEECASMLSRGGGATLQTAN